MSKINTPATKRPAAAAARRAAPAKSLPVHYGTQALNTAEQRFWQKKGVGFKPILEFSPLTKAEQQRLKNEYYVKNNRVGFQKLYDAVRRPNGKTPAGKPQFSPTRAQVQAWLSKQLAALDFKPVEKSKDNRPILVSKIGELIQIDYLDLSDKMRWGQHRYILNCIDVLSKKAYSRSPLNATGTGPTAAQTLGAFKEIMVQYKADNGFLPQRLQTDNGSHFLGAFEASFAAGGEFHGQIRYNSGLRYRATSQSVVERYNKTLRNMIRRYVADVDTGGKDWFSHLGQFVANYNRNKHASLRLAPDAANNANLQDYKDRQKERAVQRNQNLMKIPLHAKVRLMNFRKAKSEQYKDEPNWWPEVYTVFHVFQSKVGRAPEYALDPNPPTTLVNRPGYQGSLKSARRKFTAYELQVLAVKGDADYDRWQVSTSFHEDSEEEDPAPAAPRAPAAAPPGVVGKAVDVKFYSSGAKSFVVDKASIARRKKSSGTFYEGRVLSYDKKSREHTVKFEDGVKETYNLTDKQQGDFVAKGTGWRIAV